MTCQIYFSIAMTINQLGSTKVGMVGAGLCPFIVVSTPVTISIYANPKQQNAIYRVKAQIPWKRFKTNTTKDQHHNIQCPFKLINLKVIKLHFFCNLVFYHLCLKSIWYLRLCTSLGFLSEDSPLERSTPSCVKCLVVPSTVEVQLVPDPGGLALHLSVALQLY